VTHHSAVRRATYAASLLVLLLCAAALLPAMARADWVSTDAHVVDTYGTGYVNLLNVQVAAVAANDSTPVTTVEFSDDGEQWSCAPYTGAPLPWVLSGESGPKTLFVRFAAQDGSLSAPLQAAINVDTVPPRTAALNAVRCRRGASATFRFSALDPASPRVEADLVISRRGHAVKTFRLGWITVGSSQTSLRLKVPRGRYTWCVQAMDLAHWAQDQALPQRLVVR